MDFTPDDVASLRNPTWLEVIEISRQTGLTAATFAAGLERIQSSADPLADVDSLQSIGVALWLLSRRAGETRDYQEWVSALTLDDMIAMLPSAPENAPSNRAERRTHARKAPATRGKGRPTT